MDLFDHAMQQRMNDEAPLAARLRPRTLEEFVGQEHIIGEGRLLRRAIASDRLFSSIIFTGPPGTGKTTLARLIASHTKAQFESISAVLAGISELRKIISEASDRRKLYNYRHYRGKQAARDWHHGPPFRADSDFPGRNLYSRREDVYS